MKSATGIKLETGLMILFWTVVVGAVLYVAVYGVTAFKNLFSSLSDSLGNIFSTTPTPPILTDYEAAVEKADGIAPDSTLGSILGGTPNIPGFGTNLGDSAFGTVLQQDQNQ